MFILQFFEFIRYFGKGYYLKLLNMLFLAFMASLLDFVSVAIIFPFVMLIMNPDQLINSSYFRIIEHYIEIPNNRTLLAIIGGLFLFLVILKNIYMIFNMYWQNKIIKEWSLDVKKKLMMYFLYSPYEENLSQSNSQRIFDITNTVDQVFELFVFKVIIFISNTIVVAMIFSWLVYLLPVYTFIAIIFFVISASIQNFAFRKWGKKIADEKYKLTSGSYETLISSLTCIKDIKISGSENFFYTIYKKITTKLIPLSEKINLIPIIPQFVIEIIFVLTVIILCIGIFIEYNGNPTNIMIAFGIVTISIYRMAPLIYKSQVCINYINIYKEYLEKLINIYNQYKKYDGYISEPTSERMPFKDSILLDHITYSYDKKRDVIKDVSLEIQKGEFIGIIGLSGAGKTTLVDIIMGLLLAKGNIYADNVKITPDNIRTFQNLIGYVSQNINTVKGTISKNVAWGIDEKDIDRQRVIDVLKTAQLYDQLTAMPNGIDTELNQDGTGLSQGQKQRIGIARALYKNPEILILDEATSSLDVKIENELTEILNNLKKQKTIIAIAHRISTLKNCDRIIYLDDGRLIDIGTFMQLSEKYPEFQEIIKLSRVHLED